MKPERRIAETAAEQSGAFTRHQARDAGLSDRQLQTRVVRGDLVKIGTRTYRSRAFPSSALAELAAVMLDIGEPCWSCGPTAAALLGFDSFELVRPYHIVVLRGRHIERTGVKVHTTIHLPLIDRATAKGIPVTSGADADRARPHRRLGATDDSA
jgi:hypothetical protein